VESHTHVLDPQGKPIFISIVRDTTRTTAVEKELQESDQRFRTLAEATNEGVTIHERGIILAINQRMVEMFGYPREELIGRPVVDFAAPESRETVAQNIQSGIEKAYEAVGVRKDGTKFTAELHGKAIPYMGRSVRVTTIRDITERRQTDKIHQAVYLLS
jgi:PAS domain S-box-containing protein